MMLYAALNLTIIQPSDTPREELPTMCPLCEAAIPRLADLEAHKRSEQCNTARAIKLKAERQQQQEKQHKGMKWEQKHIAGSERVMCPLCHLLVTNLRVLPEHQRSDLCKKGQVALQQTEAAKAKQNVDEQFAPDGPGDAEPVRSIPPVVGSAYTEEQTKHSSTELAAAPRHGAFSGSSDRHDMQQASDTVLTAATAATATAAGSVAEDAETEPFTFTARSSSGDTGLYAFVQAKHFGTTSP